mmetsp:Transcript_46384/g.91289  ORF Transcript_46384/g.91289 Transcript_46384/m.91289 type:complete len:348 (-) Transcript_46384:30-1073(-)
MRVTTRTPVAVTEEMAEICARTFCTGAATGVLAATTPTILVVGENGPCLRVAVAAVVGTTTTTVMVAEVDQGPLLRTSATPSVAIFSTGSAPGVPNAATSISKKSAATTSRGFVAEGLTVATHTILAVVGSLKSVLISKKECARLVTSAVIHTPSETCAKVFAKTSRTATVTGQTAAFLTSASRACGGILTMIRRAGTGTRGVAEGKGRAMTTANCAPATGCVPTRAAKVTTLPNGPNAIDVELPGTVTVMEITGMLAATIADATEATAVIGATIMTRIPRRHHSNRHRQLRKTLGEPFTKPLATEPGGGGEIFRLLSNWSACFEGTRNLQQNDFDLTNSTASVLRP